MNNRLRKKLAVLLAPLVVGAFACRPDDPVIPETGAAAPAAPPADANAARPAGVQPDSWLTTKVQARFFADAAVRGDDVDVSTTDGVVTLAGTVRSDQARTQAAALAGQVDGVTRVDNQLTVEEGRRASTDRPAGAERPPTTLAGRFDAGWTTTKIQAQYFADADVKGRNIDVTTDAAGTVTLRGRVESEAERQEALRIAGATEGVRRVVDELRLAAGESAVAAGPGQPAAAGVEDAWITAKIQSKYFLDADVKGRDIDVDTDGGVVTLSGTVADPTQRRQAVDIARNTDGVRRVEDKLTVHAVAALAGEPKGPTATLQTRTDPARVMDPPDSWITTTIQSKFFLSDGLRGATIDVGTARGVVTLKGQVDSADQRRAAEEIARGTKGVRRVVNRLTAGASSD
jgi:osmotically-inducible protein OsmY